MGAEKGAAFRAWFSRWRRAGAQQPHVGRCGCHRVVGEGKTIESG
ncbi:hypothetical protein [Acetobacter oeni]|nr:hypothetical protein [Acetobacter oeni]MBB3882575.1 hypothetical protein [Acetobacter oeni]